MAKVQVLVVEDEDRLRDVLVEVLESGGYTAEGVGSAADGLARFDDLRPDLIILDMLMPGMDGFEFLARLRTDPARRSIPVLISSTLGGTLARAVDPSSAATLGIVGVLGKPLDLEVLLGRVRDTIGPGKRAGA